MFTGIVAELGEVTGVEHHGDAAGLTIRGSTEGVALGESIAVNGVCLTVTGILGGTFTADVMGETLSRSGLGALTPGDPVNLEADIVAKYLEKWFKAGREQSGLTVETLAAKGF